MSALTFNYSGLPVRVVGTLDAPVFVAADVCRALEIQNTTDALSRLDDDEKGIISNDTLGGPQQMSVVTESGLYSLILGSRKPQARDFKRWVTHEVLPAIRKTGAYQLAAPVPALPKTFAEALRAYAAEVERTERLALTVAELESKAAFFDAVADSKTAIEMGAVANVLAFPDVGRTTLFRLLRVMHILQPDNRPYQQYIDRGYFRVIEQKYAKPGGEICISLKTLCFQKGLEYIRRRVAEKLAPVARMVNDSEMRREGS